MLTVVEHIGFGVVFCAVAVVAAGWLASKLHDLEVALECGMEPNCDEASAARTALEKARALIENRRTSGDGL